MSSIVVSMATYNMKQLNSYYLQVDMNYDNRSNCPFAILQKLSRDILNTCDPFGGCFATPERDLSTIHVICQSQCFDNEVLKQLLENERIFLKMSGECDSFAIEKCFQFTFSYYLEKIKWHRIGESFVQHGFLSWKQTNIPKISVKAHCTNKGELFVRLEAEVIRIFPFEHWMLDRDDRFDDLDSGVITKKITPRWVNCLPKLGKGRVAKVHRRIPPNSPFSNYDEIKSYWKNTYGYILPVEEPCVYFDVLFNNGETMMYPFFCVLTGPPDVVKLVSNSSRTKQALQVFFDDFNNHNLVIAGEQLTTNKKDCKSAKNYLDVMSMVPVKLAKLKSAEKKTHQKKEDPFKSEVKPLKKVYPMIPKRKTNNLVEVDSREQQGPSNKRRPGCGVAVE